MAATSFANHDPVLEHMRQRGIPLTRANYIKMAGLVEPLDAEHEGYLLTLPLGDGDAPPGQRPTVDDLMQRMSMQKNLPMRD